MNKDYLVKLAFDHTNPDIGYGDSVGNAKSEYRAYHDFMDAMLGTEKKTTKKKDTSKNKDE